MEFTNRKSIGVVLLATLAVLGHWNVWEHGIYALGWNTSVFWLILLPLLWLSSSQRNFKKDKYWLLPLIGIALSYSLFENPWLKLISCFVLPIATGIFYSYGQINSHEKPFWNLFLIKALSLRALMPLSLLELSLTFIKTKITSLFKQNDSHLAKRISIGLLLLMPIATVVLILLSSADQQFSHLIKSLLELIGANINWTIPAKVICIFVLTVVLFSILHAWSTPFEYTQKSQTLKADDVIVGIVMGGIFAIYLLFLWLQLDNLIVASLPNEFEHVERLVKSGFWQLFFLSIFNTVLFFVVYKNTGIIAQIILRLFIIASGLLLLSAAWRMGLYVYWYGLSYEKFFASYTSAFALIVFIYLLIATMSAKRKDVLCFIAFTALWSYSAATLMPVERIIFHSNVQLEKTEGSRIRLSYLRDLSLDIANDVEQQFTQNKLWIDQPRKDYDWNFWLKEKRLKHCNRAWYEWRLSLLGNCK